MYAVEDFRSKLESNSVDASIPDRVFSRTMLDFVEREADRLYLSGEERYRLKIFGAEFTAHGHRRTLRVRVAFVSDEIKEQGEAKTSLERINFTYTFSPRLSPQTNLRRFRRYLTRRAASLQGIEPKLVLSEVLTKRIQVVFGLVTASLGLISIIALIGGFFSIVIWLIVGLIAGAMARIVMPGKGPMSLLSTMLLGIVGSIVGGVVSMLVWRPDGQVFMNRGGIVLSIIGAVILVLLWHRLHPGTQRP
jgi:uncharacterized membrane protein YeaQ/YmgE (transglycosylase-associated protein family)